MTERICWIGDSLPMFEHDDRQMDRGDSYGVEAASDYYPEVKRPIGFMRHKLRVRVKAWTQPIIKQET